MKDRKHFVNSILSFIGVFLSAMLFGAVIIVLLGENPIQAYVAMFQYALGDSTSIVNVLNRSMGLILSGLCAAVAFNAGIFNVGGTGQIYLAAMAAALAGYQIKGIPPIVHIPLVFLAGISAGAIGAWIPGYMKVRWKVDEVISTIMLNSIFFLFTSYLAVYPFRDPARWSGTTPSIELSARLPFLIPSIKLRIGFLIAFLIAIGVFILLKYTDQGYRWHMIGLNDRFANYGGINVGKEQIKAMVISGMLAGMAGAVMIAGYDFRYWEAIAAAMGWDGVLIAMLAQNNALGIIAASLLFAVFKNGALGMEQVANVPTDLTSVLLAVLILFFTGRKYLEILIKRRHEVAKYKEVELT